MHDELRRQQVGETLTASFKTIAAWLRSRKVELGLGVRVTVAAMGALAIALALGLKLPLWAVLTSIIVTQMSVGRSLKATRDYLIGTVGGALYGAAVAILIPHNGEGALLAVLVLAVAPLAFIAAINPSLNVATITAIIVLLLPIMSHADVLDSAIDRVLEVTVGALTGLLVSFLVLPSRAHSQVRANAAKVLELMASALHELLSGLTRGRDNEALHRLQDGIGTALAGLTAIGAEAERERAARLTSGARYRTAAANRAAVAPRSRDDRTRHRGAVARGSATTAGIAAEGRQRRLRRLSQGRCGEPAGRQASAADVAGPGRAAGLRSRGRGGAQRRSDAGRAGRCGRALFRAGIFAGADAAEPEGPGTLRDSLGGFSTGFEERDDGRCGLRRDCWKVSTVASLTSI